MTKGQLIPDVCSTQSITGDQPSVHPTLSLLSLRHSHNPPTQDRPVNLEKHPLISILLPLFLSEPHPHSHRHLCLFAAPFSIAPPSLLPPSDLHTREQKLYSLLDRSTDGRMCARHLSKHQLEKTAVAHGVSNKRKMSSLKVCFASCFRHRLTNLLCELVRCAAMVVCSDVGQWG